MLPRVLTKDSRSTKISVQSAAYIEPFAAHIFAVANSILWQLFQTASNARTLLKPCFFLGFFMVFTMCTQRTQVETPTEFEHLRSMENHDLGAPKINKNQYLEVKIGDKNNKLQRKLIM